MARPDILRGTYVNILMGDGALPEVFTPLCGITTRDLTDQVNTSDAFVRDCALPEEIPMRAIIASGRQWDLTGEGWMNRSQLEDIEGAMALIKNWRFEILEPADDKVYGGYWAGAGMLTNMTITGADDEFTGMSITIASDGEWEFTAVP